MAVHLVEQHVKVLSKNRIRRLWKRVVGALCCAVAFCTVYALILPAITASGQAFCSKEEHQHADACYERVLACALDESHAAAVEGHTHSDACYQAVRTQICQLSESESILNEAGETIQAGHAHTDACYESTRSLVCGLEESVDQAAAGHTHDDSCYELRLTCGKEEHEHSRECFIDKTADVETAADWEKTLPSESDLTGVWADDVLAVAESQIGYQESQKNYVIDEDKGYDRGYTRYGAWWGDPYGDWCAMFASFCLYYAGVSQEAMPQDANCQNWITALEEAQPSLWHFAQDDYSPQPGDLVFFDWDADGVSDHVGIVVDVSSEWNGVEKLETIEGNSSNCVERVSYVLDDQTIMGYGELPQNPDLTDSEEAPALFAVRAGSATDLETYLKAREGSVSFTLTDMDSNPLPQDDEGNYIVTAQTSYLLTLHASSPNGFEPGLYDYQLPAGLVIAYSEGTFVVNGVEVGEWVVHESGLVVMDFNDEANKRTEVVVSATMGMGFSEEVGEIEFDGNISVTVRPPDGEYHGTLLSKWGHQGNGEAASPDESKIYWTVQVIGDVDSTIPGDTITDELVFGDHFYTESDMAAGITFGASEPNAEEGGELKWHSWTVYPGDPGLTWDKDGWKYKIPEEITCVYCGDVTLGSNGWTYYINYSSTPTASNVTGYLSYQNRVQVDEQEYTGWANMQHGSFEAGVVKSGAFLGDSNGGRFVWEVSVTVPGMQDGQKADYSWHMLDTMWIQDASGNRVGHTENTMNLATVRATVNGETFDVPNIVDAPDDAPFVWENSWSDMRDGVYYLQEILIHARCDCTEETCPYWVNGSC